MTGRESVRISLLEWWRFSLCIILLICALKIGSLARIFSCLQLAITRHGRMSDTYSEHVVMIDAHESFQVIAVKVLNNQLEYRPLMRVICEAALVRFPLIWFDRSSILRTFICVHVKILSDQRGLSRCLIWTDLIAYQSPLLAIQSNQAN